MFSVGNRTSMALVMRLPGLGFHSRISLFYVLFRGGIATAWQVLALNAPPNTCTHLEPIDADRQFARVIYEEFRQKPGAEHIASQTALTYLAAALRVFHPREVLELGGGIGTMTKALLMHPAKVDLVVTTENNDYCASVLRQELVTADSRLILVTRPEQLAFFQGKADMIVGDGGFYRAEEFAAARPGTVFFTEGERQKLRALFANALARRGLGIYFRSYATERLGFRLRWKRVAGLPLPVFCRGKRTACSVGIVSALA